MLCHPLARRLCASCVPAPSAPSPCASASTPASTRRPSTASLWGVALVDQKGALVYGRNARRLFIPGEQHQAGRQRGRRGAAAARLDGAAPASTPAAPSWAASSRATWCSTAGATRPSASAATPPTPCARAPATPTRSPGCGELRRRTPAARRRVVIRATWWATAAGSSPLLVHPGWETFDLNWWYAAPVSGLGLQRQQRRFHLAPGDRRRARRP